MGLYADLQSSISTAFNGDLSDAVKEITISHTVSSTYDAATGSQVAEVLTYDTRGVVSKNEASKESDSTMSEGIVDVLILDSEKEVDQFVIGMDVLVGTTTYEVNGLEIDPVGATHTLTCRPKNANN